MIIEVPDWCIIGKTVLWRNPEVTGYKWVKEKIISYTPNGFFHKAYNCPVYFSYFSDYGTTIIGCEEFTEEFLKECL